MLPVLFCLSLGTDEAGCRPTIVAETVATTTRFSLFPSLSPRSGWEETGLHSTRTTGTTVPEILDSSGDNFFISDVPVPVLVLVLVPPTSLAAVLLSCL